jgi:hypothetical protein
MPSTGRVGSRARLALGIDSGELVEILTAADRESKALNST